MSVIVYRAGVIAADTRAYLGRNHPSPGAKWKIRALPTGELLGCTTPWPGCSESLMNWYQENRFAQDEKQHFAPEDSFTFIVVMPNGQAYIYDNQVISPTGPLDAPYFAIGSGAEAALGAFAMGATAVQAAEIACAVEPRNCGLPVRSLTHAPQISNETSFQTLSTTAILPPWGLPQNEDLCQVAITANI